VLQKGIHVILSAFRRIYISIMFKNRSDGVITIPFNFNQNPIEAAGLSICMRRTTSEKYTIKGIGTRYMQKAIILISFMFLCTTLLATPEQKKGEEQYRTLSKAASGKDSLLLEQLNTAGNNLSWNGAPVKQIEGNLRHIASRGAAGEQGEGGIYFIRKLSGEIFILSIPKTHNPLYTNLEKMTESRMTYRIQVLKETVNGRSFDFARFVEAPSHLAFEIIFKTASVIMLFLIMVGMGMTLTVRDFMLVIKKPQGILIGLAMQYGIMPLAALGISYLCGYYQTYPYIYIGMILVTASPAGVTSNLLTHYAEGDLALSISLTSISTIICLFFTPLLLMVYGANVSDVAMPGKLIAQTIIVLVIIPLGLGMGFRVKWRLAAEKISKILSALGIVMVLFIIIAGIASNLHVFNDRERYSVMLYVILFFFSVLGITLGALMAKLTHMSNYQSKSVALESGIRNSVLGMTIALLIQDKIGDFYSSMFIIAGIYGLFMYIPGFTSAIIFKKYFH
jgi:predicted Na+-dependent transporter